jgi:hypothetical protein
MVSENKPVKVRFILGFRFKKSIVSSMLEGKNVVLKHNEMEKINRKKKKVVKFMVCPYKVYLLAY